MIRGFFDSTARPVSLVALCIIGILAASCNNRARESTATSTTDQTSSMTQNTTDSAYGAHGTPSAGSMSDANIAAALVAANDIDVQNGQLAQSKARSSAVKQFAQMMVSTHSAAKTKTTQLTGQIGISPEPNDMISQLQMQANAKRDSLRSLSGANFDRAYMDGEIAMHQQVLDLIDQQLLPNAQNADLKALVQQMRPVIAQHLDHAKTVESQMAGSE